MLPGPGVTYVDISVMELKMVVHQSLGSLLLQINGTTIVFPFLKLASNHAGGIISIVLRGSPPLQSDGYTDRYSPFGGFFFNYAKNFRTEVVAFFHTQPTSHCTQVDVLLTGQY